MKLEQAKKLTVGQMVNCPPDRGFPGGAGKVVHIQPEIVHQNASGVKFIWVTIERSGTKSIWPSNRLS